MVTGFLLDFMHLVDGGVIEDWFKVFLEALETKDSVHDAKMTTSNGFLRVMVSRDIPDRIHFLNKFRMLEQTRPLR